MLSGAGKVHQRFEISSWPVKIFEHVLLQRSGAGMVPERYKNVTGVANIIYGQSNESPLHVIFAFPRMSLEKERMLQSIPKGQEITSDPTDLFYGYAYSLYVCLLPCLFIFSCLFNVLRYFGDGSRLYSEWALLKISICVVTSSVFLDASDLSAAAAAAVATLPPPPPSPPPPAEPTELSESSDDPLLPTEDDLSGLLLPDGGWDESQLDQLDLLLNSL